MELRYQDNPCRSASIMGYEGQERIRGEERSSIVALKGMRKEIEEGIIKIHSFTHVIIIVSGFLPKPESASLDMWTNILQPHLSFD